MPSPKALVLNVSGMSCNHCVMHVKKALADLPGVKVEDVQVGMASVVIDESVPQEALVQAIKKAGYQVESVQ
jgi:copper chaperone CopZ